MDGTETSAPLGELMLPIETLAAFPLGPSRDLMWQGAQLIWKATKGTIIPRLGQLQCFVELQSKDVVYVAATGSGKTLVIAMMLLQHPEWIGITISPLKELQRGQVRPSITNHLTRAHALDRPTTSRSWASAVLW